MQGIQGNNRSRLLQSLDNAAQRSRLKRGNERLAHARRVKIFMKYSGQGIRNLIRLKCEEEDNSNMLC